MDITLSPETTERVDREVASGRYQSPDQLVEEAVRRLLDDHRRSQSRLDALRRLGKEVDESGLYDRVLIPGEE